VAVSAAQVLNENRIRFSLCFFLFLLQRPWSNTTNPPSPHNSWFLIFMSTRGRESSRQEHKNPRKTSTVFHRYKPRGWRDKNHGPAMEKPLSAGRQAGWGGPACTITNCVPENLFYNDNITQELLPFHSLPPLLQPMIALLQPLWGHLGPGRILCQQRWNWRNKKMLHITTGQQHQQQTPTDSLTKLAVALL